MSRLWRFGRHGWELIDNKPIGGPIQVVQLKNPRFNVLETIEELCARYNGRLVTREEYRLAIYNFELTHPMGFPICVGDRWREGAYAFRHGFFLNPKNGHDLATNVSTDNYWRLRPVTRGFQRPCWRFAVAPYA
ncbi:MAG: hypothetical protein HY975_00095 [Candidatus Kerfeldbacteria bacterium]|nr:hypothetical protein [Candidatus Kerfeldbacteria bacterium]